MLILCACKKESTQKPAVSASFDYVQTTINGNVYTGGNLYNVPVNAVIRISFSQPINQSTVAAAFL